MASRNRTAFKLAKSYTPIYTGGAVASSSDGKTLYTTLNDQIVVTDVTSGAQLHVFQGDSSAVTTLAVSPESATSAGTLVGAHRSLALRFYSVDTFQLVRSVGRAHDAPIITSACDPTGSLFATGSADGVVKVWDAVHAHCTHVFRGHGGVISALYFDIPSGSGRSPRLVTASDDCRIRVWDLATRKSLHVLDGHSSVVRGLAVTPDGSTLISGGRDRIFNVWDLPSGALKQSIPVYETLEAIGLVELPEGLAAETSASAKSKGKGKAKALDCQPALGVWTAGDLGRIRIFDIRSGREVEHYRDASNTQAGKVHEIVYACTTRSNPGSLPDLLITAHLDQNITYYALPSIECVRQIAGYNDEVVDLVFLSAGASSDPLVKSSETQLAVATNSDIIRLYDLNAFNTAFLAGHQEVVLCLSRNREGSLLMSGSKDRTARLWRASTERASKWECVGICEGHLESVGAVNIARRNGFYAATASQDKTVKIWDLTSFDMNAEATGSRKLQALTTLKVHEKDINSLDISPNDRLLATASQDRTAKLFAVEFSAPSRAQPQAAAKLVPLGVFKGHKRGVWSVKFSPTEQCVVTASGDRSIKLWNINDFTCLKTFEGHTNTVLRTDFLPSGAQLISCAADGLLKVWNIKDEECVATMDNHEEKIWATAMDAEASTIVSGGADAVISFWEDVTELEEAERAEAIETEVLQNQDLANYVEARDYRNAIILALSMDKPRRLFLLLSDILAGDDGADRKAALRTLASILHSLQAHDIFRLLLYIRDWNAKGRDSEIAQTTLHALLTTHPMATLLKAAPGASGMEESFESRPGGADPSRATAVDTIDQLLEALVPYTERHFARSSRLEQESAFLDFILAQMDEYAGPDDDDDDEPIAGR